MLIASPIQSSQYIGEQIDNFNLSRAAEKSLRSRLGDEVARIDLLTGTAELVLGRLSSMADSIEGTGSAGENDAAKRNPAPTGHLSRMGHNIDTLGAVLNDIAKQAERLRALVG